MLNVYKLTFKTSTGEYFTMPVSRANPAIPDIQVKEVMDKIIASNAIVSSKGLLTEKEKAQLVKTEIDEIAVG